MTNIYHNAIRHCLISEIKTFQQEHQLPYWGIPRLYHGYLIEFLRQIESLNPEEFSFKNSPSILLDIANIIQQLAPPDSTLTEFNKKITSDLKKADIIPVIPYRMVLNKTQWEQVWEKIVETKKNKIYQVFFEEEEEEYDAILHSIAHEKQNWYLVNPLQYRYSYHLNGSWIQEMYSGDNNYWIDENFTVCIYADAYGYPQVYR